MRRSLLFITLLLVTFSVQSQTSYIFNRLSNADGLNTNRVNCVWQDKKGFLWIGTENGLQRFDGRKFVRFRSDETKNFLPTAGIDQIFQTNDDFLWLRLGEEIGQFNLTSFKYKKIPFEPNTQLPPQTELRLFLDSKNNLFLVVREYALMWFDPEEGMFSSQNLPIKIPEGWGNKIHCVFEDKAKNDYWISSDEGLACYSASDRTLYYKNHNPNQNVLFEREDLKYVFDVHLDKKGRFWMIYWNLLSESEGSILLRYDPSTGVSRADTINANPASTRYKQLDWIFESQNGQVWSGGINALCSSDAGGFMLTQNSRSTPGLYDIKCRNIKHLYEDREQNLWFSTDNGLYVIGRDQQNVYNYTFPNDAPKDILVSSILETNTNENWISTFGNGIMFFDKDFYPIKADPYQGKPIRSYKMTRTLCQHSRTGLVWSGCRDGYLIIFDPQTRKIVHELKPPVFEKPSSREGGYILKIVEAANGDLLFATNGGKLIRMKGNGEVTNESFECIREFNSPIRSLLVDTIGRIWVGTNNLGIFVLDADAKNQLNHFALSPDQTSSISMNRVNDMIQFNDSVFFVSSKFLNTINIASGQVTQLSLTDGLPGLNVRQMIVDKDGILWFTCNKGLGSYNYGKHIFASYNEKNGIVFADKLALAKVLMKNGEIWFGGENSLYGFRPEGLSRKKNNLKVSITDLRILNTYSPLDSLLSLKQIRLEPDQNSLIFYFSTLSFMMQDQLLYYYRLKGVNKDWIRAEGEPYASYSSLKPGKYEFEVKCINMQGEESSEITKLGFRVLPRFYQTWWFITFLILLTGWLTYFIYRLRLTKLLAVERIRNKVARDLHDDVGSTLSTINILSSMAKTKLLTDPVKTSEYISKITENSQHMMDAMDDIVWSIKPDNDNLQKIVARMREYASGILEPKDIEISFDVSESIHDLKLSMEIRRDLFLTFKEAINNVAKYARCTKVDVTLRHESKRLLLEIRDNGIGFDVNLADSGNGLGNMQKRAEALHGAIKIISQQGFGTTINLNIPVHA